MSKLNYTNQGTAPPQAPTGETTTFVDAASKTLKSIDDAGVVTDYTSVADNAITNAKLADMLTARIKGRVASGTGDPEDLTGTQVTALLDVFTDVLKGLVPQSGGGTANFLRADGQWAAPPGGGGGGGIRTNVIVEEPFIGGNVQNDEIALYGWHNTKSGSGNETTFTNDAGHPGIIVLNPGASASGRNALHLGESAIGLGVVVGGSADIEFEALVRFENSVAAADLEHHIMGLGSGGFGASGNLTDGVYIRVTGGASPVFTLVARDGASETSQAGSTVISTGTWYRIGFVISDPGGAGSGPSIQMTVNGNNEGSAITTDVPTAGLAPALKADAAGGSLQPHLWCDYFNLTQDNDLED